MIVLVCVIAISDVTNYIHEANASQTTNHINEITSAFIERYIAFNTIQIPMYYNVNMMPINWIILITLFEYTKNPRV